MKKKLKISFLIPAHNEEKIIFRALDNLERIKKIYPNTEVLVGLDGCTDNTEDVVRKYKFVKYFVMNERAGKPPVIDKLIRKAKGDIIIIHDADWIFKVVSREKFLELIDWFSDSKLGGVAESFTLEWTKEGRKSSSVGFLGEMWADKFWLEYQKKNFTTRYDKGLYVDKRKLKFPFLVNIFRKELYEKSKTLADDFEKCFDILRRGYKIRIIEDIGFPRFVVSYKKVSIKDLFKKKMRTAFARQQIGKKYSFEINKMFYAKMIFYILRNLHKTKRLKAVIGVFLWMFAMFTAELKRISSGKILTTKEGWTMRAERGI